MNQDIANTKITVSCPSGHRLRGDIALSGSTIRCPKCGVQFTFAPLKSSLGAPVKPSLGGRSAVGRSPSEPSSVTDTGVMRILGDPPPFQDAGENIAPTAEKRSVTDTGVMRILGDSPELPPPPEHKQSTDRPCPRCGLRMSVNVSVCQNCHCYVGVMPRFMQDMIPRKSGVAREG